MRVSNCVEISNILERLDEEHVVSEWNFSYYEYTDDTLVFVFLAGDTEHVEPISIREYASHGSGSLPRIAQENKSLVDLAVLAKGNRISSAFFNVTLGHMECMYASSGSLSANQLYFISRASRAHILKMGYDPIQECEGVTLYSKE